MKNYRIFTDSGCDLEPSLLDRWGVSFRSLTFKFSTEEKTYDNNGMSTSSFYNKMRDGEIPKTSAVNSESFRLAFEEILAKGEDLLYIGFSSGLSATCNSARIAKDELLDKYPERKIIVIDSLSASGGLGFLIKLVVDYKNSGADIIAAEKYIRGLIPRLCHWFTVDDLNYLKRGGRISPTVAFVGNALGIKPVLHMDDEGRLVNMQRVRGRRGAINLLCEKYAECADKEFTDAFISHADCMSDAILLKSLLLDKYKINVEIVNVGPVIGAHSGPGTLALFFVGDKR